MQTVVVQKHRPLEYVAKPDLDADDIKNYRPISNLPVLTKLLERIVAKHLVDYLKLRYNATIAVGLQSRALHGDCST